LQLEREQEDSDSKLVVSWKKKPRRGSAHCVSVAT